MYLENSEVNQYKSYSIEEMIYIISIYINSKIFLFKFSINKSIQQFQQSI